ncbi:hypothetical protein EVAR_76891_1 [Eumeta japonica]|uniref:Uncharacterized protein n=1 Tax=Eumeta variegata TaxID=151549 RepID=A0A4C1SEY7_EUMVA|nr:hypothetical protein EVAR_76891_1 [Eumeta japonica]
MNCIVYTHEFLDKHVANIHFIDTFYSRHTNAGRSFGTTYHCSTTWLVSLGRGRVQRAAQSSGSAPASSEPPPAARYANDSCTATAPAPAGLAGFEPPADRPGQPAGVCVLTTQLYIKQRSRPASTK